MFRRRSIRNTLGAALAFALTCHLTPARSQTNAPAHQTQPLRARGLIGMDVEDTDGHPLGKLRNLAFNVRDGRMLYAIVGSGGFLGIRSKLRAVPPDVLTAATAKRNTLALHSTAERWVNSPTFKGSQAASLGDPDRMRQIYLYYGKRPPSMAASGTGQSRASRRGALAPTGNDRGQGAGRQDLKFASDIIDATVLDRDQTKVGSVLDLLVAFDEKHPAYVIYSADKLFRTHDNYYAIALENVRVTSEGKLSIPANRAAMEHAPDFSKAVWDEAPTNGTPAVLRYQLNN